MAAINLNNEYQKIAQTDTWSNPSTGYEGYWRLYAKINNIDTGSYKVYIDVKMTITINYRFRSISSDDKRQIIIKDGSTELYNNSVPKISDKYITYDGTTYPGYEGNPNMSSEETCYEWKSIPINFNDSGDTNTITVIGKFISTQHDVDGDDLKGDFVVTNIEIGGKISIKTGNNTWSKGQVHIKTGNNTWSEAKAVWVKTGNNTWSEAK